MSADLVSSDLAKFISDEVFEEFFLFHPYF